jgi:hypothetical protein
VKYAFVLLATTGCAQLLGLDNTKFDQKDAPTDSASVCDGAPACRFTAGRRSVCGVMTETGVSAGAAMRVATPTGRLCSATLSTEGPCALTLYGQSKADYFAGMSTQIAGAIDDCGRYVVPDLDPNQTDVAIVFSGTGFVTSTTLLLGRPTGGGTDLGVVAPIIRTDTATRWGTQLSSGNPPAVTGSYLVSYVTSPFAATQLRVNGASVGKPPTAPWGAYFVGPQPFGDLDPALTETSETGSALVVPGTATFMLGGFHTGKTCIPPLTLQVINNVVISVRMSC